jgi:predicted esterase
VNIQLKSKLMGREMSDVLVISAGGARGRPLLVFLHGYGAAPSDMVNPAFLAALRRLGDRAPVVFLRKATSGGGTTAARAPGAPTSCTRRFLRRSAERAPTRTV